MSEKLTLFWVFLAFCNYLFVSHGKELLYNGFKHAEDNLTLNGDAQIESNGLLRLTNSSWRLIGHALYPSSIRLKGSPSGAAFSFSTVFAFAIVPELKKLGGHGLAFVMVPDKDLKGALPSQYLGLLNSTDNGNLTDHVFAVEFDTRQNFEFADINDNHVGIDINSMHSRAAMAAGRYVEGNSTAQNLPLQGGETIFAWIDYDSAKTQIDVRLDLSSQKPKRSILSFKVDLSPYFNEFMYVGFSASTGVLASSHYILGWSFNVGGEAVPLDPSSLPSLPSPKRSNLNLIIAISIGSVLGVILVLVISVAAVWCINNRDVVESWELNVGPHRFSYKELKEATNGFRDKELLGFGGFGRVYKGTLPKSGTQVAVKRISRESKQGFQEFLAEIATIGKLRHRNLVQLLGWCRRHGDLLLVYDFMPNRSLDKYLFDQPKTVLSWKQRFNIIKGVASGLLYLHEGWDQTVIHRDVKAGNVLLDAEMNGRLGDFGLAKLYDHGSNPNTTRVVGTMGYLAPELTRTGKPTTSSDVFAFGAFLLEVACGRKPIEPKALLEEMILVDFVWDRWKMGAIFDVMDPKLQGEYDEVEALTVLKLGIMCSADAPADRPTMRQVVRYLEGEIELPEVLLLPGGSYDRKGGDIAGGSCNHSEDYLHPSNAEKDSAWTTNPDVDLEAGSVLALTTSAQGR